MRFDFEHATVELTHLYGYDDDDWLVTPAPGHEDAVDAAWERGPADVRSSHRAQLAAILESLRNRKAPPVATSEARRTMQLVAGVYASAFHGRPVGPEDLGPDSPFYDRMNGDGPPWAMPRSGSAV